MREVTLPKTGPKRKLMEAAEQLFAEKGFEVVSVRDITQLTKANVAAVNYHFGSRENLRNLVISKHALPVAEERLLRLEAAEKKWGGKALPIEEIIDAFVRPIMGQVKKTELAEGMFYELLGRIFALRASELPGDLLEVIHRADDRFGRAFAKSLPSVAEDELAARIHFLHGAMNHLLIHQTTVSNKSLTGSGMESALVRLVRFAVAGIAEGSDNEKVEEESPQAMFNF